jgi:hypothetical protein
VGQAAAHDGVQTRTWLPWVPRGNRAGVVDDGAWPAGEPLEEEAPGQQLVVPDRVTHDAEQVVDGADVGSALAEEGVVEAQERHPDLLGDRSRTRFERRQLLLGLPGAAAGVGCLRRQQLGLEPGAVVDGRPGHALGQLEVALVARRLGTGQEQFRASAATHQAQGRQVQRVFPPPPT